jgi:hypothetical protein
VFNIALLAHLHIELLNLCLLELLVLADQAEAQDSGENDGTKDEDGVCSHGGEVSGSALLLVQVRRVDLSKVSDHLFGKVSESSGLDKRWERLTLVNAKAAALFSMG